MQSWNLDYGGCCRDFFKSVIVVSVSDELLIA